MLVEGTKKKRQAKYEQRNDEASSCKHCSRGKAVLHIPTVCVCMIALVNQHAKRMRRIILASVACLAPPYFSGLSYKWQDSRKRKKLLNIKCVLISPQKFFWNIFQSKKTSARYYKGI